MPDARSRELEIEAHAFARHLVGRTPPPELVARYCDASALLFPGPDAPVDAAVLGFVRRHPWSVSFLEPAAGFLRPGGLLRNKVLVMSAILEASPAFADEFLFRPVGVVTLALRVAAVGTLAVLRTVLGLALYPLAARARA
ncbi:MAG TPA: hypothetical protein VKA21_01395 [Candidatus Binatia bacterium]|nr:hypothetical protein [Candidatus Binatia bacterium]